MIRFAAKLSLCLAVLPWVEAWSEEVGTYQVGVAKVDVTPDYPIRLNGFGFRRAESEGVSQNICARALAIGRGDDSPLVLIALDSLGVRMPMLDRVTAELKKSHGLPRKNFALTFSHSHCTPKVNGAADNIFSQPIPEPHQEHIDRYTKELEAALLRAARQALDSRKPSTLEWAVGKAGFAKNRRTAGGPVDHDLPVMLVRDAKDQSVQCVYTSYACHCVTLSFNKISGDWAGYAAEMIERQWPGSVALVSIGAGSDQNPQSGVTGDKTEVAQRQGAEIADEVKRLLDAQAFQPIQGAVNASLEKISLAFQPIPDRADYERLAAKGGPAGYNATTQLAKLDRGEKISEAMPYAIQTWTFGDSLCMIFLAGEVCVDYSLRLKSELNRDRIWLNAYSNDFCAYIPSERLVREGGYGGGAEIPYFALPTTLAAGLEAKIIDEVKRQTPASFHLPQGTQGVPPKSPEESLRCMKIADDLHVQLVAAEPLVSDPVTIDFGPDGRLWVVEMTNYNRGVDEQFEHQGRIRWLIDENRDGRFDRGETFIDGLRFPTDVKVWRKGVLICDAPDILYAEDTDGDGRADIREKLFSGFAVHNAQARVNSLRWGLDHWLHGSCGLFGGRITSIKTGKTVDLTGRDFRLNPDTGEIEAVTGRAQQGRERNDWGDWFGCSNGVLLTQYVVDPQYSHRNPHVTPPASSRSGLDADALKLIPPSDLVRFKLSGQPGRATSACGLGIYRDLRLGKAFHHNAFTCEPVHQSVHRIVLRPAGVAYSGHRAEEEVQREFLSSTDRWFRPVQARMGPDGGLWIVDMYRYVIEHARWIPKETLAELDLNAGQGRGRIYRILPRDTQSGEHGNLNALDDAALIELLDAPNGLVRDLAHQLLVWRDAHGQTERLEEFFRSAKTPQGKIHALRLLESWGRADAELLKLALADSHPEVLVHAVRVAEPQLDETPTLLARVIALAEHESPRVQRQLAWTLGGVDAVIAARTLARLYDSSDGDVRAAVLSSLNAQNIDQVFHCRVVDLQKTGSSEISRLAILQGSARSIRLAFELPFADDSGVVDVATRVTDKLIPLLDAADARDQLPQGAFSDYQQAWLGGLFQRASRIVQDTSIHDPLPAIQLLGRPAGPATRAILKLAFPKESVSSILAKQQKALANLIDARHPQATQLAAVSALSRIGDDDSGRLLASRTRDVVADVRYAIVEAMIGRASWAPVLLSELEQGSIPRNSVSAAQRQRLLTLENAALRQRATRLLASSQTTKRSELVAKTYEKLTSVAGDSVTGRVLFRKHCGNCHRLENEGHAVGPDLNSLTNRDPRFLLTAILDPNRDVDARYLSWTAQRTDGRSIAGLLVEQTPASIRLREPGGKDHVILRTELDALRSTNLSTMPEGLERDLDATQFAHIIAYLREFQSPYKRFSGNQPKTVTLNAANELRLPATIAEIRGGSIRYEPPFKNIGYWHGERDTATWRFTLPEAGRYDIYLDASCAPDSAGNRFRIEGRFEPIGGEVSSTGGWDRYQRRLVAKNLALPAGLQYLVIRPAHLPSRALFDLREVVLVKTGRVLTD